MTLQIKFIKYVQHCNSWWLAVERWWWLSVQGQLQLEDWIPQYEDGERLMRIEAAHRRAAQGWTA